MKKPLYGLLILVALIVYYLSNREQAAPTLETFPIKSSEAPADYEARSSPDTLARIAAAENATEESILDVFCDSASGREKWAQLNLYLRANQKESFFNKTRWADCSEHILQNEDVPNEDAARLGNVLRFIKAHDTITELERKYRQKTANIAEKLSAVTATDDVSLVEGAFRDKVEDQAVRELASWRLGEMGEFETLSDIVSEKQEESLIRLSALKSIAEQSRDVKQMENAVKLGEQLGPVDSLGRRSKNVLHVALSESPAPGKAEVLYEEWLKGVDRIHPTLPTTDEISESIVSGFALARAIWLENDKEALNRFPAGERLLSLASDLDRHRKDSPRFQAHAEFLVAFINACSERPTLACDQPGDPRVKVREQLRPLLRQKLSNGELSYLLTKL